MIDNSIQHLEDAIDALLRRGCSRDFIIGHTVDFLGEAESWAPVEPIPVPVDDPTQMQLLAHQLAIDAVHTALSKARKP
jgi:hypothetical protein